MLLLFLDFLQGEVLALEPVNDTPFNFSSLIRVVFLDSVTQLGVGEERISAEAELDSD